MNALLTPHHLIDELSRMGVTLSPNGSKLRVMAPQGCITPELKEALVANKQEILALLRGEVELANLCSDLPVLPEELLQRRVLDPIDLEELVAGRLKPDALRLYIVSWLAFRKQLPFPLLTFEQVEQWLAENGDGYR